MLDKTALLARRLGEGEHEIPGFGTVKIRGLSVAEVRSIQALTDLGAQERRMVACGLLDPALTEDEVGTWQENSAPGEIDGLVGAIAELSGMAQKADKSGVSAV